MPLDKQKKKKPIESPALLYAIIIPFRLKDLQPTEPNLSKLEISYWKTSSLREDLPKYNHLQLPDICGVMGPMGSGKTRVGSMLPGHLTSTDHSHKAINTLSVTPNPSRMHSPRVRFWGSTQQAVLVDTLGFDDTNKSDMQILQMIDAWMRKTYVIIFPHAKIIIEFLNISSRIGANNMKRSHDSLTPPHC